jgi:flavin-dependent dehydrogenase
MADRADLIIVGVGLAGAAAALAAVRSGRHPLLIDTGDAAATGAGILGPRDLPEALRSGFPIERVLRDRRLAFLGAETAVTVEYQEPATGGPPSSFLRTRADPWLAEASVSAGAERRVGHVDRLSRAGASVEGIVLDGEILKAPMTILADGPRATELGDSLSPRMPVAPVDRATISVERLALGESRVADRFGLSDGSGCSLHAVLGAAPPDRVASGFLITHRDSVSVGVRVLGATGDPSLELSRFRNHPAIAPFLLGATPITGSAGTTPAPFRRRRREGPGWRLAGDAGALPAFHGAVLRGRNRAFRSGWLAGEAAGGRPSSSRTSLSYARRLRSEQLLGDGPELRDPVIGDPRIHAAYPDLLAATFHRLMTESGGPKEPVTRALRATRRSSGRSWPALVRDATGAMRRL